MMQATKAFPFSARRAEWLAQLRTASLMLEASSDSLVRTIDVTQRFAGASTQELQSLSDLATQMAGEYGLGAVVVAEGPWLTAKIFRRGNPESDSTSTRHGRLGWLSSVWRRSDRTGGRRDDRTGKVNTEPSGITASGPEESAS